MASVGLLNLCPAIRLLQNLLSDCPYTDGRNRRRSLIISINGGCIISRQERQVILFGYSLGKAQRILEYLDKDIGNIYAHTAVYNAQKALHDFGLPVYDVKQWTYDIPKDTKAMIVAPPSAAHSPWLKRFEPYATGVCSGWMQVRGLQRRGNADAGFALSDHADYPGLLDAIKATGAEKVYVTHGYQSIFSRYLNEIGIESEEVITQYGDDESGGENTKEEIEES